MIMCYYCRKPSDPLIVSDPVKSSNADTGNDDGGEDEKEEEKAEGEEEGEEVEGDGNVQKVYNSYN